MPPDPAASPSPGRPSAGLTPIPVETATGPTAPTGLRRALVTPDISGASPDGAPVVLHLEEVGGPMVLAFLTTNCDGCQVFWRDLGGSGAVSVEGRPPVPAVIVTRGPGAVDPGEVQNLGGGPGAWPDSRVPLLVMSDSAWAEYGVLGYPFFVLVDTEERRVLAETVGFGWTDLTTMVAGALRPL